MRNKMLVYIVWVFVLALGVQSCNNDSMPNAPKEQRPISFDNIATRADESDLADLQANGFGVWAVVNNDILTNYILMENQEVVYNNTLGWHYDPVQYWIDDSTFTFLATYPYNESSFSFNEENTSIELSVTETPSQTDFLIAKNITNTSVEGYSTTVELQFQHVLTSVGLNIWRDGGKHQNDQMRIKTVTLGNILKSGTYSTATDADAGAWTYNGDKLTVEVVNTDEPKDDDNIGAAVLDNGTLKTGGTPANPFGDMMLLPQTLDDSNVVSLKIVYELKRQNAADWEEAELETVLPSSTWEAGRRYTYNVVLSSVTDITIYYIQTKVDPWGTPQVGGTVIIK